MDFLSVPQGGLDFLSVSVYPFAFRQVEALGRADGPMNLARLLAAADDLALRDPPRALRIAADLALQQPIPPHQRLLALAQAASGRFDDAIETARRLLAMPDWMLPAPARDQARELPRPAWPVDDPLLSPPPFDAARVLRDYPEIKRY